MMDPKISPLLLYIKDSEQQGNMYTHELDLFPEHTHTQYTTPRDRMITHVMRLYSP